MRRTSADVLVVGARCAGASLAIRLARAGASVVAVDRDTFPSDQPLSTHVFWPYATQLLVELGLETQLREIASPVRSYLAGTYDTKVWVKGEKDGFCPRRIDLDAMLIAAAREANVDVRTKTKLVELVREDGRVVGGIVEHDGEQEEIRASVVVGADGPHSTVAKLVGAAEYKTQESPRAAYWGYWPRPSWYADDDRYRNAAILLHQKNDYCVCFPAGKDQLLLGVFFPKTELAEWRGHHRETYLERVRRDPVLGPVAEGSEPIGKVIGWVSGRFFFREAAGPGWALVGDAGLFKDPAPGFGITDAFRDAKALATAIEAGSDEALVAYWRERDVQSLDLFHFAEDTGKPGYDNPFIQMLFRRIDESDELKARMLEIHERRLGPSLLFKTSDVIKWTLAELLRGRFGVWKPFLAAGKRGGDIAKELAAWTALADEAKAAAAKAPRRFSFATSRAA